MTNDNILDVLNYMFDYLFETVLDEEEDNSNTMDNLDLKKHLKQVGFNKEKIDKALSWLEDIAIIQSNKVQDIKTNGGVRLYSTEEQRKLGAEVIGLLMFMENSQQLSCTQRESIIEQVMRLEQSSISLDDFKWVVMMVLGEELNNTNPTDELTWFDALFFSDDDILQ